MDLNKITYEIETHPLIVALVVFALGFIIVRFRSNSGGGTSNVIIPSPTAIPVAPIAETYYQQFNTIPTVSQPQQTTPPPTTPIGGAPMPKPKNTPGLSNNFGVYTTVSGDTLNTITIKAKWAGRPPSFLYNYRNNAEIFHYYGIDVNQPNAAIPAGIKISI